MTGQYRTMETETDRPIGRSDSHADELLQEWFQHWVCVNKIVVRFDTFFAGNAAKHYNDGFASFLRHLKRFLEGRYRSEALLVTRCWSSDLLISGFSFLGHRKYQERTVESSIKMIRIVRLTRFRSKHQNSAPAGPILQKI